MPRTRFRFRDWFQVLNWESRISSPIPVLRTISITKKHFFVHFLRVKTAKIVWIRSGARISIPVPIPVPHPSKSDSDTGSGSRIIKSLIPSPIPVLKSLKIRVRFRDRDESLTESLGVSVPRRENRESLFQSKCPKKAAGHPWEQGPKKSKEQPNIFPKCPGKY